MTSEELEPDLRALLQNARAIPPVPAELHDALKSRLAVSIAAGAAPTPRAAETSSATAPAQTASVGGTGLLAKLAAKPLLLAGLTFTLGTATGIALHAGLTAPAETPAAAQLERVPTRAEPARATSAAESEATLRDSAPTPELSPQPSSEPVPKPMEPMPKTASKPTAKPVPAPLAEAPPARGEENPRVDATPSPDSALLAERALLEMARTALRRSDAKGALVALQRHRAEHEAGQLAEERDALEVLALAATDDAQRARSQAEAFFERYPKSLFAPLVRQTLTSIPARNGEAAPNSGNQDAR